MAKYIQLPATMFFTIYPEAKSDLPPQFLQDVLTDPEYVVRMLIDGTRYEIGYPSDPWAIK